MSTAGSSTAGCRRVARVRQLLLGMTATLLLGACSSISGVPVVGGTPTSVEEPVAGDRAPGDVLPSDQATLAVVSVSAVVPGRPATATMRYGTYQTCHAQVVFSDQTALPLGAYESGLGQTPTWRWDVPPTAPSTGTFTVSCGVDLFHVPFTATGGTSVPVVPASLRPTVLPWPTPLNCTTTVKGCE